MMGLYDRDDFLWTAEFQARQDAEDAQADADWVATWRTGFTDCGLCGRDTQGAGECASCMRSIDRFYDEPAVKAD